MHAVPTWQWLACVVRAFLPWRGSALPGWPARAWPPALRRVLTDPTVHRLSEQVGVAGVAAVFLDQVTEEPAQAGMVGVGVGDVDELVESAVGDGCVEPGTGPFDGSVP